MTAAERRATAEREHASLVIKVLERDALPVRAIPYVSGWTLSPDVVAQCFAKVAPEGFEKLEHTDSFHLVDGEAVKLLPKEWDRYVAALEGLEAQLREQYTSDERGYAAWVSHSVSKLPAGVFVWLEDFVTDFQRDYDPERLTVLRERGGDRALNFAPFLDGQALGVVLEGFERREPFPTFNSHDTLAGVGELVYNGRFIDWSYWVEAMPTLGPSEAARLMAGLDPDLYEDLGSRPVPENDPTRACAEARRMERLAVAQAVGNRTPEEWYFWALESGFSVHRGFFLAARGRHLLEQKEQVLRAMPRAEASRWEAAPEAERGRRQVSTSFAGHRSDAVMSFPEFCAEVEERLARWRLGRFELIEAAEVLAQSAAMNASKLAQQMDEAIRSEKLALRLNNIRLGRQHIPREYLWHRTLFQDDVNQWLAAEAHGAELRLTYPYSDAGAVVGGDASGPIPPLRQPLEAPDSAPRKHRIMNRSDPLGAVVEAAKSAALDRDDYLSVWAALVNLAQSSNRPAPLLGYVDDEGVKYQVAEGDGTKFLTKDALRKRMYRSARGG